MSYGKLCKDVSEVFDFLEKDKEILGGVIGIEVFASIVSEAFAEEWAVLPNLKEGDVCIIVDPKRDYSKSTAHRTGDCAYLITEDIHSYFLLLEEIHEKAVLMGFGFPVVNF